MKLLAELQEIDPAKLRAMTNDSFKINDFKFSDPYYVLYDVFIQIDIRLRIRTRNMITHETN